MTRIQALFEVAKEKFQLHATPETNRIIFSGIYGTGKTTFLEDFFCIEPGSNSSKQDSKYEAIRLFPVNYSIASNEDIFQYIKYDILIELIRKGITLDSLDLGLSHKLALYTKSNWVRIASDTSKAAVKIGKTFVPGVEYIETILDFFQKQKEGLDKYIKHEIYNKDEVKIVDEFTKGIENIAGGLFEDNAVIKIIEKKIESLKGESNKRKEVVLIIDDLDRIDPDHIFRILNAFSAHFDLSGQRTTNKFGFDKIILVCDIENLKSIFYHKYGERTNFYGYIDKFYSDDIFEFNIVEAICDNLLEISSPYKISSITEKQYIEFTKGFHVFHFLVKGFVRQRSLNLRSLVKFLDRVSEIKLYETKTHTGKIIKPGDYALLWQLMLLDRIFGDKSDFINALKKLDSHYLIRDTVSIEKVFRVFLTFATMNIHEFSKRISSYLFAIEGTNGILEFSTDHNNGIFIDKIEWQNIAGNDEAIANAYSANLIPLMLQTVSSMYKYNILQ